jgi:hypothetical protein
MILVNDVTQFGDFKTPNGLKSCWMSYMWIEVAV